ncbi:MAG: response regulator [Actinobacteria bacterium]|nr:response regulator [Actinomycetota bacterium]
MTAPTTASKTKPAKTPKQKAPTLIICDDDQMTRKIFRAVAERCGYEVIAGVESAIEALQAVAAYRPDVLLLDLVLPHMSGEDIVAPIREVAPGCTIVICSTYDPAAAIRNGAVFVVPKGSNEKLESTLNILKARRAAAGV